MRDDRIWNQVESCDSRYKFSSFTSLLYKRGRKTEGSQFGSDLLSLKKKIEIFRVFFFFIPLFLNFKPIMHEVLSYKFRTK